MHVLWFSTVRSGRTPNIPLDALFLPPRTLYHAGENHTFSIRGKHFPAIVIAYGEGQMDIQTLKYIYDVAIYGSITRAAQYNYISPSHLSRQVKKIEEMFSISIFERSYNGVSLTKQGQEFIRYIEPILKGTIALEKHYSRQPATQGLFAFRIAIHHNSLGNQAAVEFIQQHIESCEYADIVIDSYNSLDETIRAVNKYRYALGVIQFSSNARKRVASILCTENLKKIDVEISDPCVLLAQTHPLATYQTVSMKDLDPYPRIFYVDEELSNQQDISGLNLFDFDAVKKRILIKERAQLFHYLLDMNAYYIGPKLVTSCRICEGMAMVHLYTPEKFTIYTSVIYSPTYPNTLLIDQYVSALRSVAQTTSNGTHG